MSGSARSETAFFRIEEDGLFHGNDPARGPWSADHCHAGPVTGLVARAAENAAGPEKILTRLTLDVLRPVPLDGLRIETEITRKSKTLTTTRVTVHDINGTVCVASSSMHLVRKELGDVPTAPVDPPKFEDFEPSKSVLIGALHSKPAFANFIDMAYRKGDPLRPGPKTVWMRVPALLEGEKVSPIQSVCALADCGNGISWNEPPVRFGFMNTDLTLQIHREPESDWLAAEALSHWHGTGVGMSQAILHDMKGPIGVALQTLVLHPVK
ncbi:thioesterase family protein [Primorskyibacter sp. S87]|uniref:thioesterase family protein n=1 Tax=Primorskyibacter sp. S87 TaxID=3415126 RepID=UPI003C7EAC45